MEEMVLILRLLSEAVCMLREQMCMKYVYDEA